MQKLNNNTDILMMSDLTKLFRSGCKSKDEFKIGLEYEKIAVNPATGKAISFSQENGISIFLKKYREIGNWEFITENNIPIGIKREQGDITIEPGSQFEISLSPSKDIASIIKNINEYNDITSNIADEMGFQWIGYGIQPVSTYENIELIPKKRYDFMSKYLPTVGENALVMMKETAGMQVTLDYESEEDAMLKLRTGIALSPIVSAMFANSPIRNGKETGYRSYRSKAWLSTDNSRCGLISEKLFDLNYDFTFEDYAKIVLEVPMIFISRNGHDVKVENTTFREFLNSGYQGFKPTIDDWYLHLSLYFPDVRLKNFLEFRNCDCQRAELMPALPAFWKGIIYNKQAIDAALDVMKVFNWQDLNEIRHITPKEALNCEVNGVKIHEIAKELIDISVSSLDSQEASYLEPLKYLVSRKLTPADIIIDKWQNSWNKDIKQLIKYSKL